MRVSHKIRKEINKKFGKLILNERLKSGLSQEAFAQVMGFKSRQILVRYETGAMKEIMIETFEKFAEIKGISLKELVNLVFFGDNLESLLNRETNESIKTKKILENIDDDMLNNLYKLNVGGVGETVKNFKHAIKIATYFSMLPQLQKYIIEVLVLEKILLDNNINELDRKKIQDEINLAFNNFDIEIRKDQNKN